MTKTTRTVETNFVTKKKKQSGSARQKTAPSKATDPISNAAIGIFVLVFAFLAISSFLQKSPTIDEPVHLFSGYSYLKWGDFRANPEHPPLAKLWAAVPLLTLDIKDPRPFTYSWNLIPKYSPMEIHTVNAAAEMLFRYNDASTLFFFAKLQMIILAIVLGWFIFLWSKKLFGLQAGIVSLFIYCLDPNILSHSQLVHTDMAFTAFFFISTYFFWRILSDLTWANLLLTAFFFGLAANAKYGYLAVLVIWGILGLFKIVSSEPQRCAIGEPRELSTGREKAVALAGVLGCVLFVTYVLIWVVYGFRFDAIPGGSEHLPMAQEMPRNSVLHGFVSFLTNYRLFPEAWIYGQLFIFNNVNRVAYLLGELSDNGFWLYFPVAFFVKTPLSTLLLILAAVVLWIRKRNGRYPELFLMVPVIVYFTLAVLSRMNTGLRHILPIYPFLFVLIGGTVTHLWQSGTRLKKTAIVLLALWEFWSSASIYPHYLAFFNEIAGGPRNGHRVLVDSNLDWGQDLPGLKRWMDANRVQKIQFLCFGCSTVAVPRYYGIDAVYLPGSAVIGDSGPGKNADVPLYLAISATRLYTTWPDQKEEAIKTVETMAPIATVGHSIYIYNMDHAIETLRREVKLNPSSAAAHHSLASLLENQGKVDEAIYHYRLALQINPGYKKRNYEMANTLARWREVKKAVNHYRLVLETDPSFVDARNRLGLMLLTRGELNEATEQFHRALKLDPSRSETHFNLGVTLVLQNNLAEAAQQFQEAIMIKPDYTDAYNNLGKVLAAQGQLDRAIGLFRRAVQIEPNSAEAYNNLGKVLAAQGQLDRAIGLFRQAVQIQPDFAEAHHSLAMALAQKGIQDEAVQHFEEAQRIIQS